MTKSRPVTQAEQIEEKKTDITPWLVDEQKSKQIKIKEILESDLPIATYLKCDHGLILKNIFASFWSLQEINNYINMLCLATFPKRKKSENWFNIVMDQEFFMGDLEKIRKKDEKEIKEIKDRIIWFIKEIFQSEDKNIFLVWPVTIDFLTTMALKFKLSDKSLEEITNILSSKITTMQPEQLQKAAYKIEALHTISIYTWTNDTLKWILQNKLLEIDCTKLEYANFVLADLAQRPWDSIWDFKWIEKAFDIYTSNPDKKLILMSVMTLEDIQKIQKDNDKLKFLLSQKNFRFLYLFDTQAFSDFQKETWFDFDKDIPNWLKPRPIKTFNPKILESLFEEKLITVNTETEFQSIMANEITYFLHNRSNRDHMLDDPGLWYEQDLPKLFNLPEDIKSKNRLAFEDKLITLLHLQHPSFKLLPRKNNLQWIVDIFKYINTQLLHEWERFEGVFVDWDWCLYDNKKQQFNQNIIDMIIEYESQWKKIIIWSGWNLEMKQKLLDNHPQLSHYKIQSKTDYKWWTVEIAIDNDPQELLRANAKIKSENHIKV